jgi:hypothetical protein
MRNHDSNRSVARFSVLVGLGAIFFVTGCELQQRRVDVKQASGADSEIDPRFGLTADAQDPSERDKELGYGKWKAKPETAGTEDPTSPTRRGSTWGLDDH